MAVSGHRSETSFRSYCKMSSGRKREMSSLLSKYTNCSDSDQKKWCPDNQNNNIVASEISEAPSSSSCGESLYLTLQRQQVMLAQRFSFLSSESFVPNFNFNTGLDKSPERSSEKPREKNGVVHLRRERVQ